MKIIIVIPCYNEEKILENNIKQIYEAVKKLPHDIKIVISDNNSRDRTAEIGKRLASFYAKATKDGAVLPSVDYFFVGEPGKGAAVMEAWKKFVLDRDRGYDADIYGFMDADLAVDLEALPRALRYLEIKSLPTSPLRGEELEKEFPPSEKEGQGGFNNIVIGSRRIAGAKVRREFYRKFISAVLNFFVRLMLKTKIKDTPCGFKFMRKEVVEKIVPQVRDRQWVFDTELVILAERAGFKILEIPVKWEERNERGSKIDFYPTARGYIKKILEIKRKMGNNK